MYVKVDKETSWTHTHPCIHLNAHVLSNLHSKAQKFKSENCDSHIHTKTNTHRANAELELSPSGKTHFPEHFTQFALLLAPSLSPRRWERRTIQHTYVSASLSNECQNLEENMHINGVRSETGESMRATTRTLVCVFYTLSCSVVSSICASTQLVNTIFFTIFPRGLQLRFGRRWNWLHINVLKHHKCKTSHHLPALTENLINRHTRMHFVKDPIFHIISSCPLWILQVFGGPCFSKTLSSSLTHRSRG